MIQISDLLKNVSTEKIDGSVNKSVYALTFDSRRVTKGAIFFAVIGENTDGHKFAQQAADSGAVAVVVSNNQTYKDTTTIQVKDTAVAMGCVAGNYYGNPSKDLQLVGITGTNGKTTTASLLYKLFLDMGYKTGLISTVANYINKKEYSTKFTTPDPITLNRLLRQMVDKGCKYCFAEISSHALEQKRVHGLHFKGAVFTNITHDHLDYHKDFKSYIYAKKKLFDALPKDSFALINADDKNADVMLQNCKAKPYKYAMRTLADFKTSLLESSFEGMKLEMNDTEVWTLMAGDFNAYNITAVFGTAVLLGLRKRDIYTKISAFTPVRGRLETINLSGITAIIDYAHTPDALKNVLHTINAVKTPNQILITVIGTGGNRDRTKRPKMASIAHTNSDKLILTSDNPRNEKPTDIINDMLEGLTKEEEASTLNISDRKEAIKTAVLLASKDDIILIAGKGHETYQEIKGIRSQFDDKEIVTEFLNIKQTQ